MDPLASPTDEAAARRRQRGSTLALLLALGVGAFSLLFFLRTADPMILIFGILAAAVLFIVTRFATGQWGVPGAGAAQVVIRCRSCSATNPEGAKYCNQCGRGL